MNQELKQYLRFFVDHRQKNQLEWLVLVEVTVNNQVYSLTKVFLFIVNYGRGLRMGADIKKKGKVEKVIKSAKKIKKVQKEVEVVLKKVQEEMKRQANRRRKKAKECKKGINKYKGFCQDDWKKFVEFQSLLQEKSKRIE